MKADEYKYAIAQCDVPPERRSQLESFRAKRRQWLAWLDGDEHHAIWTNLSSLVWTDVSYRALREIGVGQEDRKVIGFDLRKTSKATLRQALRLRGVVFGGLGGHETCRFRTVAERSRLQARGSVSRFQPPSPGPYLQKIFEVIDPDNVAC